MAIQVERESLTTKSRFVTPTYTDKDGLQQVIGSDRPAPVLDVNHLRIHEGRGFYVYKMSPSASKLASNGNIDIALAFPTGTTPHLITFFQCSGSAEFYVYEGASVSGGTAFIPFNRNRTSTNASVSACVINPTVISLGDEKYAEFISSGQGGTGAGGAGYSFECMMKPMTTYLFRLTNVSSQSEMAELRIEWYE